MKKILFVTDLYYQARGRIYYSEDLFLTEQLRKSFALSICHPRDIQAFEESYDLIMVRNAGPIATFKDAYLAFRNRVIEKNLKTYNSLDGKGDMNGKDYLLMLTREGYDVIPTIDRLENLDKLPTVDKYITKPKDGADSVGLEIHPRAAVFSNHSGAQRDTLIQPLIEFKYEVSFYFVDREFQYAFYAPNKEERWELESYEASAQDIEFAQKFIDWNSLAWGITRVDACRTTDGKLLLVELEDLNPYLSLLELDDQTRAKFLATLITSLEKALSG